MYLFLSMSSCFLEMLAGSVQNYTINVRVNNCTCNIKLFIIKCIILLANVSKSQFGPQVMVNFAIP